ncbi:MAG: DUF1622 domain-containing protein [Candidatus Micrarchaeota archaeon]
MGFTIPLFAVDALLAISLVIEVFGLILVIFAVAHSVYRIIRIEVLHDKRFHEYEHTKRTLIQKIIFALDFFVAADLIRLAVLSDFMDIMKIAIIVTIRTMLSWSLSKEIHLHKE